MGSESNWRQETAEQIKRAWRSEKKSWQEVDSVSYNVYRRGLEYVEALGGLSRTIEYINTQFPNMPILDIGAGSTRGIAEVQRCFFPFNEPWGTVLSRPYPSTSYSRLPADKVVFTPAETLHGLHRKTKDSPSQFALVTGVMSTTYSMAPEQVVKAISKIIPEGGVVKFTLYTATNWFGSAELNAYDYYPIFTKAGFGTAYLCGIPYFENSVDVLLAVKGASDEVVKQLINGDFEYRENDKRQIRAETGY